MVITNFNGTGVGFGFGIGCGFGVGWGFGVDVSLRKYRTKGADVQVQQAFGSSSTCFTKAAFVPSAPLNIFGLGAGGGCGVGLGLGWGFGVAYGSQYHNSGVTFQGVEFEAKSSEEKDSTNLLKNTQKTRASN